MQKYIRIEEFVNVHEEFYPWTRTRVRVVTDAEGDNPSVALGIISEPPYRDEYGADPGQDAEVVWTPEEADAIADAIKRAAQEARSKKLIKFVRYPWPGSIDPVPVEDGDDE